MVAVRGPSTAYDIKRALGHLAHEFWEVPHVLHYRETERLQRLGWLTSVQERSGRRRRVFDITPAGTEALQRWLGEPGATMAIRDEGELKLFFSELTTKRNVVALARSQAADYRRRLAEIDDVAARFGGRRDMAARLAPMDMGRALYTAAAEFWENVAEHPPRR
jgi:DNA-binding PadR family transcriptional regulator